LLFLRPFLEFECDRCLIEIIWMFQYDMAVRFSTFVLLVLSQVLISTTVDPNLVVNSEIPAETQIIVKPKTKTECRRTEKHTEDKEFRIAWLAPEKEYHNFSAGTSVGAMKLALAYINQHQILVGWKVRYIDRFIVSIQMLVIYIAHKFQTQKGARETHTNTPTHTYK